MGRDRVEKVKIEINNPANSQLASDVLSETARLAGGRGIPVEVRSVASAGRKGDVVSVIVLGMASSAAYDLLKAVVMRFVGRKDYEGTEQIIVDGVVVELEDLQADAGNEKL
jgi:hypothetical protein